MAQIKLNKSMNYRPEISGLRAIAVLPIIFFHAGFDMFKGGYLGVDIFFVISGYLITTILSKEIDAGNFSFVGFYERRARRILPALFFMLFIIIIISWFWLLPNEMRRFSQSLVSVLVFASNIFFYITTDYFTGGGEFRPLLHVWSLSVEEQYYFIYPAFLILIYKIKKHYQYLLLLLVFLLSLLYSEYLLDIDAKFSYYTLPTRAYEFIVGAFSAFYVSKINATNRKYLLNEIMSFIGAGMIVFSVFLFDKLTPFPGFYALVPTIGAAIIIVYCTESTIIGRLLSNKILVNIGLMSYGAYLWHHPLFALSRHRLIAPLGDYQIILLIILTFIMAYISYRYIEGPFRDKRLFNRKVVFISFMLASLAFVSFGLFGHFNEGFAQRIPKKVSDVHISRESEKLMKMSGCEIANGVFNNSKCLRGHLEFIPNMVLVGDSHAQSITQELSGIFNDKKKSFLPYVKSSCPLNFYRQDSYNKSNSACNKYQDAIYQDSTKNNIQFYVIFSRRDFLNKILPTSQKVEFTNHLKSVLNLADRGKKIILINPVPAYETHVSDYMSKNILFYDSKLDHITQSQDEFESRMSFFTDKYKQLAKHENIYNVSILDLFCDDSTSKCITQIDGVPLYYDKDHLSYAGANLIAKKVSEVIVLIDNE